MSSKRRTKAQARKDRAALKRLQKSGTYAGKIDLRKAPSRYQLQKIAALQVKRRAYPPKLKPSGATIKRSTMSEKQVRNLKPAVDHKLVTYALPFKRKGKDVEWRRFTRAQLIKFLNEYKEDDEERAEWRRYAVREEWTFETKEKRSEFRKETDLYFSGVRISQPQGKTEKVHANQHTKKRGR